MKKYILVLDQGTTSSRSIIFDKKGSIISQSSKKFKQIYPQPGWVEHNPEEIFDSQIYTLNRAVKETSIDPSEIAAIGITNQRETTILWDKKTGKPVYNGIVWQCRRSEKICERLINEGYDQVLKEKTGLVTDAYFSATKIQWLLDTYPDIRHRAEAGELLLGTIDSWLIFNLTNKKIHITDVSNASRTMLFNIHTLQWDADILKKLNIPACLLPEVRDSSEVYGQLAQNFLGEEIPISSAIGDQQAALFGQICWQRGDVKNTYGTGCFMLMNTGDSPVDSKSGLLTSVGWKIGKRVEYILEGSVFIAGAVITWLRDELKIIENDTESEVLARGLKGNDGVYFVPAFVGLGTPYWDMGARGAISGLTRGTGRAHIVRAALESIAYQTKDVLDCIEKDSGMAVKSLKVDGGVCVNDFLMQFQADILQTDVQRPKVIETTALGAAYLAGLAVGFWENFNDIKKNRTVEEVFHPSKDEKLFDGYYEGWKKAVGKVL